MQKKTESHRGVVQVIGCLRGAAGFLSVSAAVERWHALPLWSSYICPFLKCLSGFITSLLLLSIIPSFPPLFLSASLTIHFHPGLSVPSLPSHHITSSCSYIPPPPFLYLLLFITPQAIGDCKHFPSQYRQRWWNLNDREECLKHNCTLSSTVLFFFFFISAQCHPMI